ncbi:hypothetical protein V6N11_002017 [Hibiscus sabdariffa]|uniref:RNase H type-1 domain-containing protein n=1 Tax=Hibiscus sabdariffa TaxID=183260 RepID=A0ABR2QU74_9ROSI
MTCSISLPDFTPLSAMVADDGASFTSSCLRMYLSILQPWRTWTMCFDGVRLRRRSGHLWRLVGGVTSCGSFVRSSNGIWLDGFIKFIGRCSILEAEFWTVYEGLKCAMDLNVQKVIVESNSREVIGILLG